MRFLTYVVFLASPLSLTAQDWSQSHAPRDLEAFLKQSFRGGCKVGAGSVYRAAAQKGWLKTASDRKLIKRQLRSLASRLGHGRIFDLGAKVQAVPGGGGSTSLIGEIEYNNSEAYANNLGALLVPITATGTVSGNDDTDTFRFDLPLAGNVTVTTTFSGASPSLMLTNASGDENWGHHFYDPNFTVALPAGVYHLRVGGSSTPVSYSVTLNISVGAIPTAVFGTTTNVTAGLNPGAIQILVPQDGRLRLELDSGSTGNSTVLLQSSTWSYVKESSFDSRSPNGDAGLDALLPAGLYYAYIFTNASSTVAVKATFTPAAIPTLATTVTGTLVGSDESLDLYRVVVAQAGEVRFTTTGSGTSPLSDPYVRIYDQNMVLFLEGDDRDQDTDSDLPLYLPPGTYYVSSDSYWDAGEYTITRSAGTAVPVVAQAGLNQNSTTTNGTTTFRLCLGTKSRVEFDLVDGSTDGQLGILNASTGLACSWEDDENLGPEDCNVGVVLPAGDYYVYVRDYAGFAGTFSLNALTPLNRQVGDNVEVLGHGGNPLYFLISAQGAPPSNPLPGVISGNLLLDLPSARIILVFMPASGMINFMTSVPPNAGVFIQMVDVDAGTLLGTFSNLLK